MMTRNGFLGRCVVWMASIVATAAMAFSGLEASSPGPALVLRDGYWQVHRFTTQIDGVERALCVPMGVVFAPGDEVYCAVSDLPFEPEHGTRFWVDRGGITEVQWGSE